MRISDWSSDVCSSDLIDVGGIDHAATMFDEAVEDREARGAVRGPPEDIAAEDEGADGKAAVAQRAFGHRVSPCFTAGTASRGLSLNSPSMPAARKLRISAARSPCPAGVMPPLSARDRKSTRLNSSH